MYDPVVDCCSDRIVRSDGKGLKRLHTRIYCCSVGCRLADIQRKFHSSDITFGRFTDSFGFSVMGVLQSCHSESHPEIFSGFHYQKNIFLWYNNNSAHFLFLPSLINPAVLLDSEVWSNLLFLGVIASSACYLLWNIVVKQLGTIQASNYLYLNPLATTVGATIFLHEEVTPVAIVGIVLVLSGVYLASKNSRPNCTAIKKQAD